MSINNKANTIKPAKLSTTTIRGVPPAWKDEDFNHRLRVRLHAYDNTRECTTLVSHPLEHEWLKLIAEKIGGGYTIERRWPISHAELHHSVPLVKPERVQTMEKEALKAVVKDDYVAHLQAESEKYKQALTNQLIEAAEEKERRKIEQEANKRRLAAEKEANECFGELAVPDGYPAMPEIEQQPVAAFGVELDDTAEPHQGVSK